LSAYRFDSVGVRLQRKPTPHPTKTPVERALVFAPEPQLD
jgi:hypothetical protein